MRCGRKFFNHIQHLHGGGGHRIKLMPLHVVGGLLEKAVHFVPRSFTIGIEFGVYHGTVGRTTRSNGQCASPEAL